ncbi:MAG: hypothetical protein ACP5N7_07315 [Candidatus Pacearchaeota archaeon]
MKLKHIIAVWEDGSKTQHGSVSSFLQNHVTNDGERRHSLGCDEYHQHHTPDCCSSSCWCKKPIKKAKNK